MGIDNKHRELDNWPASLPARDDSVETEFFYPGLDLWPTEQLGFRFGAIGTHTSRTIMIEELATLFAHAPLRATREDYASAIMNDNCLGKETNSTRRLTNQRLGELYGLDPRVPLFRVLRYLWATEVQAPELLALLVALARDPLLRASAKLVTGIPVGAELPRGMLREAIAGAVGERLNDSTIDKVLRNVASSWTQSGHLAGRTFKQRRQVNAGPGNVALALYLADSAGFHGPQAFSSVWIAILDCAGARLPELALEAKRLGLIDLRMAGDVVDLDFKRLDPQNTGASWVA
jgi:hypothetical protein